MELKCVLLAFPPACQTFPSLTTAAGHHLQFSLQSQVLTGLGLSYWKHSLQNGNCYGWEMFDRLLLQEGCHDPRLAAFLGSLIPTHESGMQSGIAWQDFLFLWWFSLCDVALRGQEGTGGSEFPRVS